MSVGRERAGRSPAGYSNKEKVVKGRLDTIEDKIAGEKEPCMGLIMVGRGLEGKLYRSRLANLVGYQDVKQASQPGSWSMKP